MSINLQIPTLVATTDVPRPSDRQYLQDLLDATPTYMKDGQLFLSRVTGRVYFKDANGIVKEVTAKNLNLIDQTLSNLSLAINSVSVTSPSFAQDALLAFKTILGNYQINRLI